MQSATPRVQYAERGRGEPHAESGSLLLSLLPKQLQCRIYEGPDSSLQSCHFTFKLVFLSEFEFRLEVAEKKIYIYVKSINHLVPQL